MLSARLTPSDGAGPGDVPLAAALLHAAEWFNDALLTRLVAGGWPELSRNQARVFAVLDDDGASQSEVARRLGIARQSAHTLLHTMVELDLLAIVSRSDRGARVVLAPRGRRMAAAARALLDELEDELAARIGRDRVDGLRGALEVPWGPTPIDPSPSRPRDGSAAT